MAPSHDARTRLRHRLIAILGVGLATIGAGECCEDVASTECLEVDDEQACPAPDEARELLGVERVDELDERYPARTYTIDGAAYHEAAECCYAAVIRRCSDLSAFENCHGFGRPWSDAHATAGTPGARTRRAGVRAGERAWSLPLGPVAAGAPDREAGRRALVRWTERGLMEHAAVASFGRFALELLGFGAPAALVEAAFRAGRDEVRHARLCFGVASALAGVALGPEAFPFGAPGLALARDLPELAARTAREACIDETLGVVALEEELAECADPPVRKVLAVLVRDERRHAELGWRAVAWAIARGGAPVARAVSEILRVAPADLDAASRRTFECVVRPCAAHLLGVNA